MKVSLYLFGLFFVLFSCVDEPYVCCCDTYEISKNDSILKSKEAVIGLPKFLARYKQQSLTKQNNESYRLSTMHSFNKYFQVYTLTKSEVGGDFLIQEFLCSMAYANDGKLINEHHESISESEWNSFKKVIQDNCFWTLPIEDPDKSNYLDGGEWWIEGFQPNKRNCSKSDYLITFRQIPSTSEKFYNIYRSIMNFVDEDQIHPIK